MGLRARSLSCQTIGGYRRRNEATLECTDWLRLALRNQSRGQARRTLLYVAFKADTSVPCLVLRAVPVPSRISSALTRWELRLPHKKTGRCHGVELCSRPHEPATSRWRRDRSTLKACNEQLHEGDEAIPKKMYDGIRRALCAIKRILEFKQCQMHAEQQTSRNEKSENVSRL